MSTVSEGVNQTPELFELDSTKSSYSIQNNGWTQICTNSFKKPECDVTLQPRAITSQITTRSACIYMSAIVDFPV